MPIDSSIPLGITPPNPNGLAQTLGTANALIGVQSNSQKLQANRVLSDAYSQATDPSTGQIDFGKLQALATQGGAGAFLPEFMGKISEQRNQQLTYDQNKLKLAVDQQSDIRNRIGSLMGLPEFGKSDMSNAITDQITQAVQAGSLPIDQAVRELKAVPKEPAKQAQWIQQHFLNSMSGEAKLRALLPQVNQVDAGGAVNLIPTSPMTGQVAGGITQINKSLTPGEATANVTVIDPATGASYQITKAQQLQMQGAGAATPQGAPAAGQQDYTGRYPGAAATTPAAIPGGIQTGLAPSQQAGLTAAGDLSAKAAQDVATAAADAPMRLNLLQQARDALGNIQTGPGTDWRNTAASFINSLSPDVAKKIGAVDPDKIANYDEFKKILTNYASSISGSVGSGTDARLNAAITGNANPNISKLANDEILTKTIAAEKMRQAQAYAFQNSGLTPDQFTKWQTQWNKEVNPDAFAFATMTADQRQKFVDREQKAGTLGKFKTDLAKLVRSGVLETPGQ
jgi:hypothetical protein